MYQTQRPRIALFNEYADGKMTLDAIRKVYSEANRYIGLNHQQLEDLIEETLGGYDICPCQACGQRSLGCKLRELR